MVPALLGESKHRKRQGEKEKIPHWLETLGLAAAGTIAYVAALGASRRRGEKSCQQENGGHYTCRCSLQSQCGPAGAERHRPRQRGGQTRGRSGS